MNMNEYRIGELGPWKDRIESYIQVVRLNLGCSITKKCLLLVVGKLKKTMNGSVKEDIDKLGGTGVNLIS